MLRPRSPWILVVAPLLVMLAIGCGGAGETARATVQVSATPSQTAAATIVASATATAQTSIATTVPTAAPTTTPTVAPTPEQTPTPDGRVASTFGIPTGELPVAVLTREGGSSYELPLEVPPRDEYSVGLSGRYELDGRGMLFWYPELVQRAFWMKDTHIDLSIAFVDDEGVIVEIFDMEAESEAIRTPGSMYRFAIEAPLGWYAERGLGAGDAVKLEFEIPEGLRQ